MLKIIQIKVFLFISAFTLSQETPATLDVKSIRKKIMESTSAKMPQEDFYGLVSASCFDYTLPDILNKISDTIVGVVDYKFYFQYRFSKNKKKHEILLYPVSCRKTLYSNISVLNQRRFFSTYPGIFSADFRNGKSFFEWYSRKKKYRQVILSDSVSQLQMDYEGKNNLKSGSRLVYNAKDHSLLDYHIESQRIDHHSLDLIRHNSSVSYGMLNDLFFVRSSGYRHSSVKGGNWQQFTLEEIHLGNLSGFTEHQAIQPKDFSDDYIYSIPVDEQPYKLKNIPEKYHYLLKNNL